MSDSPAESNTPRIWSDPFFYAILAVIGSTYVLLIVAMLLADAVFVFTSDPSETVILDFANDGQGRRLQVGDRLDGRFDRYGLAITADAPHGQAARILDSDKPSAANSALGTPHQDFGGAGAGAGGRRDTEGTNRLPLGKVIVVAATDTARENADGNSARGDEGNGGRRRKETDPPDAPTATKAVTGGELVANWVAPVRVDRVRLSRLQQAGGEIVTYDAKGDVLARHAVGEPQDGSLTIEIGDDGVSRLDLSVASVAAEAVVEYTAAGSVVARLDRAARQTLPAGSLRTVPQRAASIEVFAQPAALVCTWLDPVRVDEVTLLDVRQSGGEIVAFDARGEPIDRREIRALGVNSVQAIRLDATDVARLEIHLPGGGALAELQFTWQRRIRSQWERDHPGWARVLFNPITRALEKPEIRYSIRLTLISCTITAILSLWIAVPIGYLMSRHEFPGRNLIDATLDIPIVLPPLVVGLSLLILFQFAPVALREMVVYQVPAVILAQFAVACAFAVRTMRATFDQIDARCERVALTLGCSRWQAFGMVVLPEARRGLLTAGTLAWARSLGEFGPLLVFAGTTRNKTEVLSTTVFLELNVGNLGAAVAVSLIMVAAAVVVLMLARAWGTRSLSI